MNFARISLLCGLTGSCVQFFSAKKSPEKFINILRILCASTIETVRQSQGQFASLTRARFPGRLPPKQPKEQRESRAIKKPGTVVAPGWG
jgi:hypothetical protein